MRRLLLLALVTIGLAPGTFVRSSPGDPAAVAQVTITPLAARTGVAGALPVTGVWQLNSRHPMFGGFSALAPLGGGRLAAGTDRGWMLALDLAEAGPRAVPASYRFIGWPKRGRDQVADLESLARDPATGRLWGGFENANLIARWSPDGRRSTRRPPEMRRWSKNSGAEAMLRLADGRFVILAEGTLRGSATAHEGLLFARDPVEPSAASRFTFLAPPDYDPVDAVEVPDGRVLILLRRVRYTLPARFDTAIALADPRAIVPGTAWRARIVQRLTGGIFADNFEGIAFVPDPADPMRGAIWLISDDNQSIFQHSLLVRFDWDGRAP
jgi:hypothetical protein